MAFFQQLRLLLWKNGLAVIRQPLWSLTLIVWPLIIFILIAVTRNHFPPVITDTCYVGPRNLPSTGFFPFLQTLMCNTDSHCKNKSYLPDPTKTTKSSTKKRSAVLRNASPLINLVQGGNLFNFSFSNDSRKNPAVLMKMLKSVWGSSDQGSSKNVSFMSVMNVTGWQDKDSMGETLDSENLLKRAICAITMSMANETSPSTFTSAVVTFCRSNNTVMEVLLTLSDQKLMELMTADTDEVMKLAGKLMLLVNQLQNETSLWENLLAIPELFSPGSVDEKLGSTEAMLTELQGAMHVIQSNFPETGATLSMVHPLLAGGINLIRYVQNWPGKGVYISLGEAVTLKNDSLSEIVKRVLQEVQIPLDKAIGLTMDKDMVRAYLCHNTSNSMWLAAGCSSGTVDMLLGWISPDKVAKQVLLAWSKNVASHDLSFARGMIHSLMGGGSPSGGQGGSNSTRNRRSTDKQPQNIEEELFLGVGQVVMDLIAIVPEMDVVVQRILRGGLQSMESATVGLETVEEMVNNILTDANQLKMTFHTLLSNTSVVNAWLARVLDSVIEVIVKGPQTLTCEEVLDSFKWLLSIKTIKMEVFRSMFCPTINSSLEEVVLMDWMPLVQKATEAYKLFTEQADYNVTLPMILSEWHKLENNSLQFGVFWQRLTTELGGTYWTNWMPDNSTHDVAQTLQQSVFAVMVDLGEKIERTQMWPEVKNYFHMVYWILNYRPGVTTQPANCSVDMSTMAILCDTDLKWPQFAKAVTQALMSPSEDVLVNNLKGAVTLLQHVYGGTYKHLAASFFQQEIRGGEALSANLVNLMNQLDGFIQNISKLPNQNTTDDVVPLISNLLQSTRLTPILRLFLNDGPVNVSTLLDIASKLGRLNQHIFTFNETDPTMPELERLVMHFLSLEGNLTVPVSHTMGHTLLTYSNYFDPDDVARLKEALQTFTNQTSAGLTEAILSAMEMLQKLIDAANGDPTDIILEYIRHFQEFVISLYRLRKIEHHLLPTGNLSSAQVTDLHLLSTDFIRLFTPESLQNLTQAGPDAAQDLIIQKFVAFLPPQVQQNATKFLQDFKALQRHITKCAASQNCLAGISEIFEFLDQMLDAMLSANSNVTIKIASTNFVQGGLEHQEIASLFFPLLLPPNDATNVETSKQALHFITLVMATPNLTVSDVQNALRQSNLTVQDLKAITELAGASNINDLMVNMMEIVNVHQCFEPQNDMMVTSQCVKGLIDGVSGFLAHLPALRNHTATLSFIPVIVNKTVSDIIHVNFSSSPDKVVAQTLNSTLVNIKMSLQLNHLATPEIMEEIRVVERLIKLICDMEPFENLNSTVLVNPLYAEKEYLQLAGWYLKRLENITNNSSLSELLQPFFHMAQMQVTLQLAEHNFTLFMSDKVDFLMETLKDPIDGAGLTTIGQTIIEILRQYWDLVKSNLVAENEFQGFEVFNTTILNVVGHQMNVYLDDIQKWMTQPNVSLVLDSMLQWGNSSLTPSTPLTDIQHLLQTIANYLRADQVTYLSKVGGITKSLNKALTVAEQPGGLQSEDFQAAILETVNKTMQLLTNVTAPLPHPVQQEILGIVQDSLDLIVHQNMSFASSRNGSLLILMRMEKVIQQVVPEMFAEYLLSGVTVVSTYFESVSEVSGPDNWKQIILNEMMTVHSLLPPNSTVRAYISVLMNITHLLLESGSPQSEDFQAAILEGVNEAMQLVTNGTVSIPHPLQQNIVGIVQDSLDLIVHQNMSFASSRNISLRMLKRMEKVIQQVVPEMFAEYLLSGVMVVSTYFESVSEVSGPDNWNQIILNEMMTVHSLLPPNSTVRAYVSVLMNITHLIVESGSPQSEDFQAAILEGVNKAMQLVTNGTASLPHPVQQNIVGIVQDSLDLIVHQNMSFASSRNISLRMLKRMEKVIQQVVPEMFAEYLLSGVMVVSTYFESVSEVSGPDNWNQLILNEMMTVHSLLPPNSTVRTYISVLMNITHLIVESGDPQSEDFQAAILEGVNKAMQLVTNGTVSLPHPVQQNIVGIVQDSLDLIVHQNMSFASSRNISLRMLKRMEKVIQQVVPEMFAEYLLSGVMVVSTYFESVSEVSGPDNWNQIILNEMMTVHSLLPPNSTVRAYVSVLMNITHLIVESGGPQSEDFQVAILEGVNEAMQLVTNGTVSLPHPVQQNIVGIVQDSLDLIVHQNMSFASSRNISLRMLKRLEKVIQQVVPEMFAEYLLSGVMVVSTYFESVSEVSGPDNWNQIILNEMMTVHSLLPPNSTVRAYVSVLMNITHLILESGQGNMSLWASFENPTLENLPQMTGQMIKLLSKVWQLVLRGLGSPATVPSLEGFTHLVPVIQQVITGKADQDTWDKFEQMLKTLLSALEGEQALDPSVIRVFEKVTESVVKNMRAENVMIHSLQMPVVTLMTEMAQSVNSSHFNLSEVSERMQVAIEGTVQAAQQANGTLKCSEVLHVWEPVREAAGLNHVTVAMWCNISLQPVLEAHAAAQTVYSQLNTTHMGVGPISVGSEAARIVKTVRSFYQVNINRTAVMEKFIMTFRKQLSTLTSQPLSPEAQLYLNMQLQDMQLQNSLSSMKMLSDELLQVAPYLQPYTEAVMKALTHVLENSHHIQDNNSSQKLFEEAAMIFLTSANITSSDIPYMMWGNFTGLNETSLTDMMTGAVKLIIDMKILGDAPMVYRALEEFLACNDTVLIVQKVAEMVEWLASTQASGLDMLSQALPKIHDILKPLFSILAKNSIEMQANVELFESLAGNIIAMLKQLMSTGSFLPLMNQYPRIQSDMMGNNHTLRVRHRRDVMQMGGPIDDFIALFNIDYPTMFRALAVPPTSAEVLETAHVFFSNPDLAVVLKGASSGTPWGMNVSREETIDDALGFLSFLTVPSMLPMPPPDVLMNAADMLPEAFPFSSVIKDIIRAMANESQDILMLMQQTYQAATDLLKFNLTDPQFTKQLGHLRSQVCVLEKTDSARAIMEAFSITPGPLCHTFLPLLEVLVESLQMNASTMSDVIFQAVIGDPMNYNFHANWSSVMTQGLGFNTSSLRSLNINVTSPGTMTVGDMLKNETAFVLDVQQHMNFDPAALHLLMNTTLPNNNLEILSWLLNLRHCNSTPSANMSQTNATILKTFCSMSVEQWYEFALLTARHANLEKLAYRFVLSEDMQSLVGVMIQMTEFLTDMMDNFLPAINQLQSYLLSIEDLNLVANNEFRQLTRGQRSSISTQATFVTISRALCSNGIMALFGLSKLPVTAEANPTFSNNQEREEMIDRFKIPRNATPFCQNMYLDMVNTTGGAIAWAFLKPMLMGEILFTPDTPTTRDIMQKANATLQEFADLRKYSEDWIESSSYIMQSAELLSHTLPMLQNSLGNSFVKNFIEMQTGINVGTMKETLSNFSNMTLMLEQNKHIMKQITTLSTLMVSLSSCVKFDRYRGFDSADQLNSAAQELAKNRNLYASVIFKLNKEDSSRKARSTSSLPPKVSYTIRMHMDNVMRTDRARNPFFVKDTHYPTSFRMRYNRGFIYLQENIDRAIIESQTGHKVTDTAVQLQPFPYPCFLSDEYLTAISFVFPLMLMIAWILFVAHFVKKLVHERELRLHEYMKMMGVNPLSHFVAWFVECATYLVFTIFILTLVLKYGNILAHSDGFLIFLYLCDYGLSILAFSYLVSSFFDKTYIAGLSGSLLYILCFFPFIIVVAVETNLTFSQKSLMSLFSPTCFSYASQYASRYEAQGEGIQWSNAYTSPMAGDTASFGWLCWLMLIDSILYFIIGAYIRMVFPGKYGIPAPWYFPFQRSFWADLCCCSQSKSRAGNGLLFTNIMQSNQTVLSDDKGKDTSNLSSQMGENFSDLPVGVSLHGLTKIYGDKTAIENLNVSFYEGHVTSLLGHNGAGKTTTMSLLTGLFAPTSGTIEVYGRDMQKDIDAVRKDMGVCMQYDVLFDHMTAMEHLLLYGQIKAPHWSKRELHEQVHTILEETGMYAHRHKRVGTLSGGMKRKLSISIAFIGGSRLVVLDEPTTGVDPCSRRSIWDFVIQYKKQRTIIMSTHHLDEAEVLSDRIAFLERGGLKCCGSPFYLKDKLGQGYKLTLTKKIQNSESERIDNAELKAFIQSHVPEARLKEAQGGDLVYSLPPFTSSNASSYRSLLTALDSNLDALQLGGYGISDTTLEEVFLQLTHGNREAEDGLLSISETVSDTTSIDSFHSDHSESGSSFGDQIKLTSASTVHGMALAWQQVSAILIKRFHHSRRDWKGLISQVLLPVLFVLFAMGLGSIKSDLRHYPELELSPALYNIGPSYTFFSNQNPSSSHLVDTMMSFPGIDNACLDKSDNLACTRSTNSWSSRGNSSSTFNVCKCTETEQTCDVNNYQPPHRRIPSSQIVYNLSGINVEKYLVSTTNEFIRNRYGGFAFGMPLPPDLQMDLTAVPENRTLSKVWFSPEGHHTMPAYLNSLSNIILRSNLPADKDPRKYAISVSSHPYFGRADDEDAIVQGMLQIIIAMCVLTGYSITTASFAIYEVHEHHSGSKRLQHIAGISEPLYWAVNFFYDMVVYLVPVTLTIAVIAAFQIPAFTDRQNLAAVSLLLVLFGFATFPWMYLLSGVFKDAEMAFITYVCINLFISVNTIMSTSIFYFMSQISKHNPEIIQNISNTLNHVFLIFPQFNFGNGMLHLARMNIEVQLLSGYGIDAYKDPFSTDSLGWMFISSFIQGTIFFALRLLLNKSTMRSIRNLLCRIKSVPKVPHDDQDEDVVAEHLRVSSGAANSDILQVNQLTKVYQHFKRKVPAVKRLSVGIPAGECFGLLGQNGAGKTTTFKMLTGDVSPTDGTAQIRDRDGRLVDIMECRNKGINIGYCPQVDALDSLLTGEEHLYFYARIRGISKRQIDGLVNYLLKRLELNYHRKIITDSYSCGTRRKLSTALALIGHPQILLLDEPSSGMDPRTKRHLWKIISEEVKGKCAVVLTSHSMEECEALCSRLAIMVKGQFRCLGSLQHIKNRFGSGFTVKMYLAEASCDAEAITGFMQRMFPSTYLKDQHSAMVEYHVPFAPGGVADIFDKLESNKIALQIKHFSVSQTTLDQVFINFAMGKIGKETIPVDNEDEYDDFDSIKAVQT